MRHFMKQYGAKTEELHSKLTHISSAISDT